MFNHFIIFLYIVFSVSFIIDVSGFIASFKRGMFRLAFGKKTKYVDFQMKPFDCSTCVTFWVTLAYNLHEFSTLESFFWASICAYLTPFVTKLLNNVRYYLL